MTYDTVKAGIENMLKEVGLIPSENSFSPDNASSSMQEYSYILKPVSGANEDEISESLCDRIHDVQEWDVVIAYPKGTHQDAISLDKLHRRKEELIQKIDNPSNWVEFVRILKYKDWLVEEDDNNYILTLGLTVIDTITY